MSTTVLFEHPLNEKMRTWLRIEFLFKQLEHCKVITNYTVALCFFRHLTDLLDVLERGELRIDILKELEHQQQKLNTWCEVPGVDMNRLNQLNDHLKHCAAVLITAPRIGQELREERLISLIRQRLNIPGGCCSFDLPALHFWMHISQDKRDSQVAVWLKSLNPIRDALSCILDLIRQSGSFRQQTGLNGFFQDNATECDLIRLQLMLDDSLYPQISGHKNRYAVRFLSLDGEKGNIPERLDFNLACC